MLWVTVGFCVMATATYMYHEDVWVKNLEGPTHPYFTYFIQMEWQGQEEQTGFHHI